MNLGERFFHSLDVNADDADSDAATQSNYNGSFSIPNRVSLRRLGSGKGQIYLISNAQPLGHLKKQFEIEALFQFN